MLRTRSTFVWLLTLLIISAIFRGAHACWGRGGAGLPARLGLGKPIVARRGAHRRLPFLLLAGFLPIKHTVSSYAGMLVGAVAMQEMARFGLWKAHA